MRKMWPTIRNGKGRVVTWGRILYTSNILVVCISRKKRLISLETGRHTEFGWKEKKDPCSAFLGGFVFKIESKSPSCSWRGQLLKFSHPQRRLLVFFLLCLWSSLVGFSELPWHTRKTAAAVRPSPKHQQTWLKRWGHESGGDVLVASLIAWTV